MRHRCDDEASRLPRVDVTFPFSGGVSGVRAVGISIVIMLVGMLVPILAAAPFYILDARAQRRAKQALATQSSPGDGQASPGEQQLA